ncbi:7-carboxy-7-deazaguanine synthase QueE [Cyclobacterium amurskyense]|uniref:7-carboxy-7-deazaguanine synthase n=1 Tax=Cyclobacterium amurskyense TaxID=320787 RepID=A0A0H4PD52_9BACT|nr:7-carboxy-7-deazaguanine synthase QueE [Cyclobacterium amurskyense]AKP52179.1 7-carboxy-7-deazaguanine synthase [Cyclobacterium amurskyense]|tara:strand:- start:13636 stop:14265 length:630 start_codon:yes stop_codon:yes gene_type:complete
MQDKKNALLNGLSLPLMEAFYTIQGEGMFSGQPAYFIRLGGCDVGCVWCDVKDSWEAERWPIVPISEMVAEAESYPARLVVITGGEPLMHNLGPLTSLLKDKGFQINMETSGAHPFSGTIDWTCLSPKKFKQPLPQVYEHANELKVVVFNKSDFDFALKHAKLVNEKCHLLLQPEWSKAEIMTPLIIDFVKENPAWRVSLQTHKYMEIP